MHVFFHSFPPFFISHSFFIACRWFCSCCCCWRQTHQRGTKGVYICYSTSTYVLIDRSFSLSAQLHVVCQMLRLRLPPLFVCSVFHFFFANKTPLIITIEKQSLFLSVCLLRFFFAHVNLEIISSIYGELWFLGTPQLAAMNKVGFICEASAFFFIHSRCSKSKMIAIIRKSPSEYNNINEVETQHQLLAPWCKNNEQMSTQYVRRYVAFNQTPPTSTLPTRWRKAAREIR